MMSEEKKEFPDVYSYHTFIFPFLWNDSGKIERKQFESCLDSRWKLDLLDTHSATDPEAARQTYSQYQYFNAAARSIIYTVSDTNEEAVRNFRFAPELFDNNKAPVSYCIKKGTLRYALRVNALRLKLYNTGIGLIVYELENTEPCDIDQINAMNDLGRRVFRPYYATGNDGSINCSSCADMLALEGITDFQGKPVLSRIATEEPGGSHEAKLARVVAFLLENENKRATVKRNDDQENEYYIEPIIDDRMFVACLVKDRQFADLLATWNGNEYCYVADALEKEPQAADNVARMLYEFVFIDGSGISCTSRRLLKELMKRHVYDRWLEYRASGELSGTVYGITEYSLVCLSTYFVAIESFLTQYIEMVMLVLAQRASLLAFERRISEVSRSHRHEKKLRESYIRFSSRFLLLEVTPQQQGIELYNRMLEILFVSCKKTMVESQIEGLFELKNFKINNAQKSILAIIAFLGGVGALNLLFQWTSLSSGWRLCITFLTVAVELLIYFISARD